MGIWEKATLERDAQCEVWLMHGLAICLPYFVLFSWVDEFVLCGKVLSLTVEQFIKIYEENIKSLEGASRW